MSKWVNYEHLVTKSHSLPQLFPCQGLAGVFETNLIVPKHLFHTSDCHHSMYARKRTNWQLWLDYIHIISLITQNHTPNN